MSITRPTACVIISTYNRPSYLRLTLEGFLRQTTEDFEIIIADDGSGDETAALCEEYGARAPFRVRQVWHEDRGYRLAAIRNLAVRNAESDCLIFNDDDCIPFSDMVERYLEAHRPGFFSFARVALLERAACVGLDVDAVRAGKHEGLVSSREERRLRGEHRKNQAYIWWGRRESRPNLTGGACAVARDDLVAINGYDEAYEGWGKEDDDLSRRLRAAGTRPVSLIGIARSAHQYHPRQPWRPVLRRLGHNIPYHKRGFFLVRCLDGLVQRRLAHLEYGLRPSTMNGDRQLRGSLVSAGMALIETGPAEVEISCWKPGSRPRPFHPDSQLKVLVTPAHAVDAAPDLGQDFAVGLDRHRPAASLLDGLAARLSPDAYSTVRTAATLPRATFRLARRREFP